MLIHFAKKLLAICISNKIILGPVLRPSVKAKEERKWVLDTINKYFDVIAEEEDEEDEDEDEDEDDYFYDDDEDEDMDELSDEEDVPDYQSTSKIRSLLSKAATNAQSQSNLATLNKLKQNLGSRISLGLKQSVENLSSL